MFFPGKTSRELPSAIYNENRVRTERTILLFTYGNISIEIDPKRRRSLPLPNEGTTVFSARDVFQLPWLIYVCISVDRAQYELCGPAVSVKIIPVTGHTQRNGCIPAVRNDNYCYLARRPDGCDSSDRSWHEISIRNYFRWCRTRGKEEEEGKRKKRRKKFQLRRLLTIETTTTTRHIACQQHLNVSDSPKSN